jgi:hypothetical protein
MPPASPSAVQNCSVLNCIPSALGNGVPGRHSIDPCACDRERCAASERPLPGDRSKERGPRGVRRRSKSGRKDPRRAAAGGAATDAISQIKKIRALMGLNFCSDSMACPMIIPSTMTTAAPNSVGRRLSLCLYLTTDRYVAEEDAYVQAGNVSISPLSPGPESLGPDRRHRCVSSLHRRPCRRRDAAAAPWDSPYASGHASI